MIEIDGINGSALEYYFTNNPADLEEYIDYIEV